MILRPAVYKINPYSVKNNIMIELWIPITIAAAFMQNLRSALQKHLKAKLSTGGATYVRFLYALPFAILYCWALNAFWGFDYPQANNTSLFLLYCLLGGLSQIIFTFLLLYLFSFKNFAVGTIYSKTELVQVALLGLILLGDTLTLPAIFAIALSLIGVMALSLAETKLSARSLFASLTERATLIGLSCGAFLGSSVVFYRGAALSLGDSPAIMRAAFALAVSLVLQTIIMTLYLRFREPGQISAVIRNWPPALMVGIAAVLASVFWFTAFALQNAAYVRALGQIELVFTFLVSVIIFKEKTNRLEFIGIILIITAILILIFGS